MNIKRIIINQWQQPFVSFGSRPEPTLDASAYEKLKDDLPSLVIRMHDKQQILKLVRARQWVEYLKLLWGRSRISKEISGNRTMNALGIRVPAITESGLGLLPSAQYDFIGFYVMEDLEAKGFIRAKNALLNNAISAQAREIFFNNVINDVTRMRQHRVVFNDFKLGNIFCNEQGDAVWIDTGISHYPFWKMKTFRKKHNIAMERFLYRHKDLITGDEKEFITALKFPL